ncbi:MAG: mechanosensitive ion channel family protein [Gemmatimonadaceae bacterium]
MTPIARIRPHRSPRLTETSSSLHRAAGAPSPRLIALGIGLSVLCLALAPQRARAAEPAPGDSAAAAAELQPQSAQEQAPPKESSASPRASVEQFLQLARAGRYDEAARYLELPDSAAADPATLARHLKAVLDRNLWLDLDEMSGAAVGDTTDGLVMGVEEIGVIASVDGGRQPVRLARQPEAAGVSWQFSRGTVQRIPGWYDSLPDRWILENLPPVLLRPGPFNLLRWQWIALLPLLLVAGLLGGIVSRILRSIFSRVVRRTQLTWDDAVLDRIGGPLTAALTMVAAAALIPFLSLYKPAADTAFNVVRVGLFGAFFWSLWRVIDVVRAVAAESAWAQDSSSSRALLPLASRVMKVVLAAIGTVALISMLGFPVGSLIAGLGLGGLAFALAAQKTVENLFGAFSLGIDQPFREGDFVKIDEFVGTVEALGLRSTRFRTLDRTLISIPNGKLAEMRLESFTARDRLRLATTIGLVYETSASQMREVLEGFERVLRDHPKIWPDAMVVRFKEFAASSLDIEIMAWFQTSVWSEFQLIRQEVLLDFMAVVEKAGSSIAFPTRTLHLATMPEGAERVEEPIGQIEEPIGQQEARSGSTEPRDHAITREGVSR